MSAPCYTTRNIRLDFDEPQGIETDEYLVKYRISGSNDEFKEFTVPGSGHMISGIPNCYDLDFMIQSYCNGKPVGNGEIRTLYVLDDSNTKDEIINIPFEITKNLNDFHFELNPNVASIFKFNRNKGSYLINLNWLWMTTFFSNPIWSGFWPKSGSFEEANGKILDAKYFPKTKISLSGKGMGNSVLTGEIRTDGTIWLKAPQGSVMNSSIGYPFNNINLSNTSSEGDFTEIPPTTPPSTRPPSTRPNNRPR